MVIRAENVRRQYGSTVALDGVSLTVEPGEVFALVGPNGAGKTTLVRALVGTTDVDGTVELFGHPPAEVAGDRIGLLPQSFSPADRLTARELVAYYAGLSDSARDVDAVLADVGVDASADTRYENLSGGQKRRVCVGTALVNGPELLVLDEPTTGIDPTGRREIRSLLADPADRGRTVLLTTHDMREAEALADRVGLLDEGRMAAVGSPADLIAAHDGRPQLLVGTPRVDAAAAALESIDEDVRVREEAVAVTVDPTGIADVAAALDAAAVPYDRLAWREPSLEDVYVDLTGAGAPSGTGFGGTVTSTTAGGRS
jgi:ABC-2 type transport system ATP-binding protein